MKDKILTLLKDNTGEYITGEYMSSLLGVSRTAIWKHISEFKAQGYDIHSVTHRGYCLTGTPDILNAVEIANGLNTDIIGKNVHFLKKVDSTNLEAKRIALNGCPDGTVVVAETQTAGRGRLGRNWASGFGKGIWMSVVLRPEIPPEDVQLITLAASVAVVKAIGKTTGMEARIKWPNDIIMHGKKVCGILTEMNTEMEQVNFLVIGIGINVNQTSEDFGEEVQKVAISLIEAAIKDGKPEKKISRVQVLQQVLIELEQMYGKISRGDTGEMLEAWRKSSATLGQQVKVTSRNNEYTGKALDITRDGKLIVELNDGTILQVASGEVSVRGLLGYI